MCVRDPYISLAVSCYYLYYNTQVHYCHHCYCHCPETNLEVIEVAAYSHPALTLYHQIQGSMSWSRYWQDIHVPFPGQCSRQLAIHQHVGPVV